MNLAATTRYLLLETGIRNVDKYDWLVMPGSSIFPGHVIQMTIRYWITSFTLLH
jgi:hypothetical protein